MKFHLAMLSAIKIAGKVSLSPKDFEKMQVSNITDNLLQECLNTVKSVFLKLGGTDQVAKGSSFVDELKKNALVQQENL